MVGQQLKAEAVEYVRRDAMAGDVTALMTLGQMYEFNVLEEYNAQKSLAYILASMEVLTANPDQVPQGKNVLAILKEGVGNYERGMTDDQKKAAHAEARELIKQIKHS